MSDLSNSLHRGFSWIGSGIIVARAIDFATILTVLFFLTKAQIGVGALVVSVAAIFEAANGLGAKDALISAKSLSALQIDSVFWFVMAQTSVLMILVMIAAPFVGAAYDMAGMWVYFIAVALKQPMVGAAEIPLALMSRDLQYERLAVVSTSATLASALTRVGLAMAGAGVWALVISSTGNGLFTLVAVQLARPFRPRLRFHFRKIVPLIRFGFAAATSNILRQFLHNVDYLLVAWFYGPAALGIYRVAFDIAMEPVVAMNRLVGGTVFPILSKASFVEREVVQVLKWCVRRVATLAAPMAAAILLMATPLTSLIHDKQGHSYVAAAVPLQILAAAALLRVMYQLVYPLILARGRPATAANLSVANVLLLAAGIITVGMHFSAGVGLSAIAAVELVVYSLLLVWVVRYLARHWGIRLADLVPQLVVPCVSVVLIVMVTEGIRTVFTATAPALQIGIVAVVTALAYASVFARGKVNHVRGL